MVLGKLPVPGRPTIWMIVGQGPIALAIGAGGGCLNIFSLIYHSFLSPSLWETVRYRLKYCLKGPLNQKQSTNQSNDENVFVSYSYPGFECKVYISPFDIMVPLLFLLFCKSLPSQTYSYPTKPVP